jgi:PhoPQ-activated pathogenicity-related protein
MTVLGELEDIQANRFVLAGSSKRAQSIWIAAAADKRVHGLVPIARPGNFLNLLQNHRADPGGLPDPADKRIEHTGSSHDYMLHVEDLHTTRGYAYMAYADPYQFLTRVNVPVMYLIGTNDRLFHSFDDHGFFPFYTGDKSFAYVANYGHGMATPTHVDALRAWVAHCFWGRPVTRLTALETGEEGVLRVRALVRSEAAITSVRLHYAVLGGPQFQDARDRYTSIPMQGLEDTLSWEVVIPGLTGEVYWYVEVADRSMGLVSTATTLLKRSFISMPGHGVGVAR